MSTETLETQQLTIPHDGSPEWRLLLKTLNKLPLKERREAILEEVIGNPFSITKEIFYLLKETFTIKREKLHSILESPVEWRTFLRNEVYSTFRESDSSYRRRFPTSVEVRLLTLKEILEGWEVIPSDSEEPDKFPEDAEECFRFLCEEHQLADGRSFFDEQWKKFEKTIEQILREHLKSAFGLNDENQELFEEWMLKDDIPDRIAEIMHIGRVRKYGISSEIAKTSFLQPYGFLFRSEGVNKYFQNLMEYARRTDELAQTIINKTCTKDAGEKNRYHYGSFESEVEMFDTNHTQIVISFKAVRGGNDSNDFKLQSKRICEVRDRVLENVVDPPIIRIYTEGPGSFFFEEH